MNVAIRWGAGPVWPGRKEGQIRIGHGALLWHLAPLPTESAQLSTAVPCQRRRVTLRLTIIVGASF